MFLNTCINFTELGLTSLLCGRERLPVSSASSFVRLPLLETDLFDGSWRWLGKSVISKTMITDRGRIPSLVQAVVTVSFVKSNATKRGQVAKDATLTAHLATIIQIMQPSNP